MLDRYRGCPGIREYRIVSLCPAFCTASVHSTIRRIATASGAFFVLRSGFEGRGAPPAEERIVKTKTAVKSKRIQL